MTRRSDGPWRRACLERRGAFCRACGFGVEAGLQIDHVKPKAQGGKSVVENGLVLCGPFGRCDAHQKKTNSELQIEKSWLDDDQIEYLAAIGWVWWVDGDPMGQGWRHFARAE